MAGPYKLAPTQSQGGIPTWPAHKRTKVLVSNATGSVGRIKMKAGVSPPEEHDVSPGQHEFDRDFGGLLLTVTNEGSVALTVGTL